MSPPLFLPTLPLAQNDLDVYNPWVCTSLGVGRSALLRYRLLPIPGLRGVLCFLFVEGRIWAPLPSPCAAIKELLLQSQQPSADGLRVSHDRSERDALLVVHLERARAPSREPVVGLTNKLLLHRNF